MKSLLLFVLLAVSLSACKKTNDKNPLLLGQWQGANWLVMDKPSGLDATQVQFVFEENGQYSADFGQQHESGEWRTEKDKLYTKATGKQEIMVKILKIDGQNLHFEMNRGGQKETLELVKKP
jgi:hypothetical protein